MLQIATTALYSSTATENLSPVNNICRPGPLSKKILKFASKSRTMTQKQRAGDPQVSLA